MHDNVLIMRDALGGFASADDSPAQAATAAAERGMGIVTEWPTLPSGERPGRALVPLMLFGEGPYNALGASIRACGAGFPPYVADRRYAEKHK
jgi:hypothetical protein